MNKLLIIIAMMFSSAPSIASGSFNVTTCTVNFSPKGGGTEAIVSMIAAAKKSINVLSYSFTSEPIANALIAAHQRGVKVQLILDKSNKTGKGTKLGNVVAAGIPTWIDSTHAIAHNKVMIVDEKIFETGSFNYTANAENTNGENVLICRSGPGARLYLENWLSHQAHSVKQ